MKTNLKNQIGQNKNEYQIGKKNNEEELQFKDKDQKS